MQATLPILGHPTAQTQMSAQIVPGRNFVEVAPVAGQVLIYDLVPVGDMLKPVARVHDRCVLIGPLTVRRLHLAIEYKALRTLIAGGFIEGFQPQPRRWAMNLASYFQHIDRCRADPDFWSRPENVRRWRDARLTV